MEFGAGGGVAMALGQAWAQSDVSSGAPVAYSYAGDATPPAPPAAAPAAPAAPMADGCAATPSCGCDTCNGGCNNQCCCDDGCVFDWDKNTWVKVGAGCFSFNNIEQHTATDHSYNFFSPNDMRIYLSGQGHEYIKFTLNTEIDNGGTFVSPDDTADVKLMDGIIQFELDDRSTSGWAASCPPATGRTWRSVLSNPLPLSVRLEL